MNKYTILLMVFAFGGRAFAQVTCPDPRITGRLTYDNYQNTALYASKVYLKTQAGNTLDSCLTNQDGNYLFCGVLDGDYILTGKTSFPWGGVNASDALIALYHFVHMDTLNGLRFKAGDVNASAYINCIDALLITERFVQMTPTFPIGDWVFEEPQVTISDSLLHTVDIKALCTGDLDGSYIPALQPFGICGDTLTDLRDNKKYPTVQIGTQCWMKANLNIGTMVTSTHSQYFHSDCSNNGILEKYCYNNDPANCAMYGGLYDWNEMMQYDTMPGIQGICPAGWHIPTNEDWCTMVTYLDPTVDCINFGYSGTTIGGKLKEAGTTHWNYPNTGATNESGFTALGGGNRSNNGGFGNLKVWGPVWSSSGANLPFGIYLWNLAFDENRITHGGLSSINRTLGDPVRCIKNTVTP